LALDVIKESYEQNYISFSKDIYQALQDLMAFNYEHIYFHPLVKSEERKIDGLFQALFHRFVRDITDQNFASPIFRHFLKNMNTDYREKYLPARIAADYIAAMTDDYFNRQYKELFFPKRFGLKIDDKRMDQP
jgi:dGTPase